MKCETLRVSSRKLQLIFCLTNVQVLPGEKADHVRALEDAGHVVCMVGDGVNDSPALAQAHVGMAMSSGTDIAMAAADVVLLQSHLRGVTVAIDLSRLTYRRIQWNFFWAFLYNVFAIPLAAGVFYTAGSVYIPPAIAGASELFSSVPVVLSSLLLRRFRPAQRADE